MPDDLHDEVTDDQIGDYWDRHIASSLLASGVPDDAEQFQRRRYIVAVRANPEALRQLAEEVSDGSR